MKAFFVGLSFIFFQFVSAQTNQTELELLKQDFLVEMRTADFVTEDLVKKYKEAKLISLDDYKTTEIQIEQIVGAYPNQNDKHSIQDLDHYIQQRLGDHLTQSVINNKVELRVFSGTGDAFFAFVKSKHQNNSIVKLPSLYEEWGIEKYYIENATKPVVYLKIPSSKKYAQHYASMISYLTQATEIKTYFDQLSVKKEQIQFASAASRITKKIGSDYDIISFGYGYLWTKRLSNFTDWTLENHLIARDDSGVGAEKIVLKNKKTGQIVKVLIVQSSKTVWGELASYMVKSFLNNNVKSVLFMGSAGSVSAEKNVYDVSVPERFIDKAGFIDIKNKIYDLATANKSLTSGSLSSAKLNVGGTHGNTYSPIEQNSVYLKSINRLGVSTLDVEQSLLAREIYNYNTKNNTLINFGALNVVTDKPYNILSELTESYDLDRVDTKKKSEARNLAVDTVLSNLLPLTENRIMCVNLF